MRHLRDTVQALESARATRDRAAFRAQFVSGRRAQEHADQLFDALTALPLSTWRLAVDADPAPESAAPGSYGTGEWTATLRAEWALDGFDPRPAGTLLRARFRATDQRALLVDLAPAVQARRPAWLLGETAVIRTGPVLVVAATDRRTARATARLGVRAVADVRSVLGESTAGPAGRPRGLVVVVPSGPRQTAQVLGTEPDDGTGIAAVATTVDGTDDPTSPVRVVVDATQLSRLTGGADQIVLTHEAVHALTGAVTSDTALWLVEGFADYVAFAAHPRAARLAQAHAVRRLRARGVPNTPPPDPEFTADTAGLDDAYLWSWLACRMVADQHGRDSLVRLYENALGSGNVASALHQVLHTDPEGFDTAFRAYLEELAG